MPADTVPEALRALATTGPLEVTAPVVMSPDTVMVGVVIVLETLMVATLIKLVKFAAVVVNDPVTNRSPVNVAPFPFPKVLDLKTYEV